jgi:hypothetical protein
LRKLPPGGEKNVDREDNEIRGQNPQGAPREEAAELDVLTALELRDQLPADQVTAQNKEQIDADPAEPMVVAWQRESHDAGVINHDDDDGQRPKKIEARLAFTVGEPRIDFEPEWRGYVGSWLLNSEKLSGIDVKKNPLPIIGAIGSG